MKFEDMQVWERSSKLSAELYRSFAGCTDFGFRDQITRAGHSIPSNIAEGDERGSKKDFVRFFQYAKGSCGELRTQVYIGMKIGYIQKEQGENWVKENRELSAMLVGFINSIKNQLLTDN